MPDARNVTFVVATLAAVGGLVIGAAVMLAAFEARDDGASDIERIEELFNVFTAGQQVEYDFVLDEFPPRFPPTFPTPPRGRLLGGFESVGESTEGAVIGFAAFSSAMEPLELGDFFHAEAEKTGWTSVAGAGVLTDFGSGQVFCLSGDAGHVAMTVNALAAEPRGANLSLEYVISSERPFPCQDPRTGARFSAPMPRVAAAFSAVSISGATRGLTSSSGTDGQLGTWSSTRTIGTDRTAAEVLTLFIEQLHGREDIELGEPTLSGSGAIVSIRGDDAQVGEYEGTIIVSATSADGGTVSAELRMTFDAPFAR